MRLPHADLCCIIIQYDQTVSIHDAMVIEAVSLACVMNINRSEGHIGCDC